MILVFTLEQFFTRQLPLNAHYFGLFIKPGIQERGTECEECGGTPGMFTRIPGNFIILTFREMFKKIPGNVRKDSGECSRRFRGMFKKIPGNVPEDSGNVQKDSGEC